MDYESLEKILNSLISKNHKILQLGCGNALLSSEMYDAGFKNITNIDISPVCIEQMARSNLHRADMSWVEMDALNMSFPEETFDIVIDKSTLDAILCGDNYYYNSAKMLMEV